MGVITLSSFISPYRNDREEARRIHESESLPFFEIYVNTPLEVCESRDPKSMFLLINFVKHDECFRIVQESPCR